MIVQALAAAAALALPAAPATPVQNDPMGPISDVTRDWQSYQPADTFCVKPDVNEYAAGGIGPTTTGRRSRLRAVGLLADDDAGS